MNICVFCASSEKLDEKFHEASRILAKQIVQRNHVLISGGTKLGIMRTMGEEVRKNNGKSIGIIPSKFANKEMISYDYTETIITIDIAERKRQLVNISDAFIIFPGGWGTLDEFAEVITLNSIGEINKPVIIYNFDNFYGKLLDFIEHFISLNFSNSFSKPPLYTTSDIDEIFKVIENYH